MTPRPTHLRLEEAFETAADESRSTFLESQREILAAGQAEAFGRPNGCGERQLIKSEYWRDLVLAFELGGCAAPEKDTEAALGAAWARQSRHPDLKPYGPSTSPVVWLDLLIKCSDKEEGNSVASPLRTSQPKGFNRGGAYDDEHLIEEMRRRLLEAKLKHRKANPSHIAGQLADQAEGSSHGNSKRDRLVRKYTKKYPG